MLYMVIMPDLSALVGLGTQSGLSTDQQSRYIYEYQVACASLISGMIDALPKVREHNPAFARGSDVVLVQLFAIFKPGELENLMDYNLMANLEARPGIETYFMPESPVGTEIPFDQFNKLVVDGERWAQGVTQHFAVRTSKESPRRVMIRYHVNARDDIIVEGLALRFDNIPSTMGNDNSTGVGYVDIRKGSDMCYTENPANRSFVDFDFTDSGKYFPIGLIRLWLMNRALSLLEAQNNKLEDRNQTLADRVTSFGQR